MRLTDAQKEKLVELLAYCNSHADVRLEFDREFRIELSRQTVSYYDLSLRNRYGVRADLIAKYDEIRSALVVRHRQTIDEERVIRINGLQRIMQRLESLIDDDTNPLDLTALKQYGRYAALVSKEYELLAKSEPVNKDTVGKKLWHDVLRDTSESLSRKPEEHELSPHQVEGADPNRSIGFKDGIKERFVYIPPENQKMELRLKAKAWQSTPLHYVFLVPNKETEIKLQAEIAALFGGWAGPDANGSFIAVPTTSPRSALRILNWEKVKKEKLEYAVDYLAIVPDAENPYQDLTTHHNACCNLLNLADSCLQICIYEPEKPKPPQSTLTPA